MNRTAAGAAAQRQPFDGQERGPDGSRDGERPLFRESGAGDVGCWTTVLTMARTQSSGRNAGNNN
jgi:hypothetical protein